MADSTRYISVEVKSNSMPLLARNQPLTGVFRDAQAFASGTSFNPVQAGLYYCENVLPTAQGLMAVAPLTFCTSLINGDVATPLSYDDALDVFCFNIFDTNLAKAILITKVIRLPSGVYTTKSYSYNPDAFGFTFLADVNLATTIDVIQVPADATRVKFSITTVDVQGASYICLSAGYREVTTERRSRITKLFKVVNNAVVGTVFQDITASVDLVWSTTSTVNPTVSINNCVKGIFSSYQYLIAYTNNKVAWSSPTNILDFTPSEFTGAGSGIPGGISGTIKTCVGNPNGFTIFYSAGIMGAKFSSNPTYPWVFQPLNNAAGIDDARTISNSFPQFALTSSGLVSVNATAVEVMLPELSDFLVSGVYESFNKATNLIETIIDSEPLLVQLQYISDRYLIASYRRKDMAYFDYALVYDSLLQATGKLKVPHVAIFPLDIDILGDLIPYLELLNSYAAFDTLSYSQLRESSGSDAPAMKYTIGILTIDGSLQVVDPSLVTTYADGVAIFGKFALKENLATTVDYVSFEDLAEDKFHSVKILTSYKNTGVDIITEPATLVQGSTYAKFGTRVTGMAHSVLLQGAFNLNKMIIALRSAGYR